MRGPRVCVHFSAQNRMLVCLGALPLGQVWSKKQRSLKHHSTQRPLADKWSQQEAEGQGCASMLGQSCSALPIPTRPQVIGFASTPYPLSVPLPAHPPAGGSSVFCASPAFPSLSHSSSATLGLSGPFLTFQSRAPSGGHTQCLGMGMWPWHNATQPCYPTYHRYGCHSQPCHFMPLWGGEEVTGGRVLASRPKRVTCFLDVSCLYPFLALSMDGWGSFSLGQESTLVILLGNPPSCLTFLPPAPTTAPFLEESFLSKQGSGYFLLKYILIQGRG